VKRTINRRSLETQRPKVVKSISWLRLMYQKQVITVRGTNVPFQKPFDWASDGSWIVMSLTIQGPLLHLRIRFLASGGVAKILSKGFATFLLDRMNEVGEGPHWRDLLVRNYADEPAIKLFIQNITTPEHKRAGTRTNKRRVVGLGADGQLLFGRRKRSERRNTSRRHSLTVAAVLVPLKGLISGARGRSDSRSRNFHVELAPDEKVSLFGLDATWGFGLEPDNDRYCVCGELIVSNSGKLPRLECKSCKRGEYE